VSLPIAKLNYRQHYGAANGWDGQKPAPQTLSALKFDGIATDHAIHDPFRMFHLRYQHICAATVFNHSKTTLLITSLFVRRLALAGAGIVAAPTSGGAMT